MSLLSRARAARRRDEGFSLIEAVVALAIVGLAMTAFYRAVGGSYGMQARVTLLSSSVELAQSHLDGIGVVTPLAPGTWEGVYNTGFSWHLEIAPVGKGGEGKASLDGGAPVPSAYWVVLRVKDRRGHTVLQLETARVTGSLP